jgi:all-trans-retinol 13,14-reductase
MRKDGDLDSLITNNMSPSQQQYNIPTGPDVFKNQLIERFPNERKAIETYFTMVKRAHSPLSIVSLLAVKLLPLWFVNLLNLPGLSYRLSDFFALSRRSVKDIVEVLIIILSNFTKFYF